MTVCWNRHEEGNDMRRLLTMALIGCLLMAALPSAVLAGISTPSGIGGRVSVSRHQFSRWGACSWVVSRLQPLQGYHRSSIRRLPWSTHPHPSCMRPRLPWSTHPARCGVSGMGAARPLEISSPLVRHGQFVALAVAASAIPLSPLAEGEGSSRVQIPSPWQEEGGERGSAGFNRQSRHTKQ